MECGKERKTFGIMLICMTAVMLMVFLTFAGCSTREGKDDARAGSEAGFAGAADIASGERETKQIAEGPVFGWKVADHVISHRGSAGPGEHSFEAYDAAIEAGSHNIEQDIVVSKDGTLYVSHDRTADRMTGASGSFSEMSDAEIDSLTTDNGGHILKLSEVFDRYGKNVRYIIELPDNGKASVVGFCRLVDEYGLEDRIVLQSFDPGVLEEAEKKYPNMPKMYLCRTSEGISSGLELECADIIGARKTVMTKENCDAVHDAGRKFCVWTLNSEEDIKEAIGLGTDYIFTDDTPLAIELERRYSRRPDAPLASIVTASDYQAQEGFDAPAYTLRALLKSVTKAGKQPDSAVMCGDYSNIGDLNDYQVSPDDAAGEINRILDQETPFVKAGSRIFVQGNHDALGSSISESGLHEFDDYLVYVINTENDFPWCQGTTAGSREKVEDAAGRLKKTLNGLREKGETRPLVIAGHVPLHFTARTSARHSTGDNLYSSLIFDAVNEAGKDLDIVYLYGHDHSKGWDCYLGGSCVYRKPGDEILIPEFEDGDSRTDSFKEEKLSFTYMNAGYTGYYMNCAPAQYSRDPDSPSRAADETLTCSVIEIFDDRIIITRYDTEGEHVLGAAGEADPYKGGIDEGLIDSGHYSSGTAGPAIIKRKSVYKSGTINADKAAGQDDAGKEKDAA